MKLLLDENLPHQLRLEIHGHDVFTIAHMGWSGVLKRAAEAGFDALITNDRGLEHEQDQSSLPVAVVILMAKANNIEAIRPLCEQLQQVLQTLKPCAVHKVAVP